MSKFGENLRTYCVLVALKTVIEVVKGTWSGNRSRCSMDSNSDGSIIDVFAVAATATVVMLMMVMMGMCSAQRYLFQTEPIKKFYFVGDNVEVTALSLLRHQR